jgi:CHAT domain-containing protein
MERLLGCSPACHWAFLDLWRLRLLDEPRTGEDMPARFREAAALFAAEGDAGGEYLARASLAYLARRLGDLDEARLERGRAVTVAVAASDPLLRARGEIFAGKEAFDASDLSGADRHLQQAARLLGRRTSNPERCVYEEELLNNLGNVSAELGSFEKAQERFSECLILAQACNDRNAEAVARYGLARMAIEKVAELPGDPAPRAAAVDLAKQAAEALERTSDHDNALRARFALAGLLRGNDARDQIKRCLRDAGGGLPNQGYCLNALARQLAESDPERAWEAVTRAVALARSNPWALALAQGAAMRVAWARAPGRATGELLKDLDAIEHLRSAQDLSSQAGLFSTWSDDYYWLAGRLFEAWSKAGDGRLIEQAFLVTERLRARTLLDTLQKARAAPLSPERLRRRIEQLDQALERIRSRQRDPRVPQGERDNAGRDAAALEREKRELASVASGQGEPASAAAGAGEAQFVTLREVQTGLAKNEALLSFLVAPWIDWRGDFGGGAWLLVATHDRPPAAYALREMGRGDLRRKVRKFTEPLVPVEGEPSRGEAERREADRQEAAAAAEIYRQLLARALADLPPGIDHLIVVPDDELNLLPFAALRRAPGEPPLALRYRFSEAPSGTLWRHWRRQSPLPAASPALALADPPAPDAAAEKSLGEAAGYLRAGLPYAEREADSVQRWVGGEKKVGGAVSEDLVRRSRPSLSSFGIVHFATHTLIDQEDPQSSGVWLSPGADRSRGDGLLRMNDIVGLRLDGRVVVLSTCSSARGRLLRGEGVLSLARAFFQARSKAVVGSLWPQWDDQAAALFDSFYRHLAEGRSLASALAAAQRDRIEAGAPTTAWAGIVALGDGDLVPLPGGRSWFALHRLPLVLAAAAVAGLLLALLAAARYRRSRRRGMASSPPREVRGPRSPNR